MWRIIWRIADIPLHKADDPRIDVNKGSHPHHAGAAGVRFFPLQHLAQDELAHHAV